MKVVVDATVMAREKKTGIDYYTRNLITAAAEQMEQDDFALCYLATHKTDLGVQANNIHTKRYLPLHERFYSGLLHYANIVPYNLLARISGDVYIFPNFSRPPMLGKPKSITFIYDLSFTRIDALNTPRHKKFLEKEVRGAVRRSTHIVVCSESTKRDLVDLYGAAEEKVSVIYPAADQAVYKPQTKEEQLRVQAKYRLPAKYILYLGTIEPRKNIALLMRAYAALPKKLKSEYSLVLAGGKGWMDEEIENTYEELRKDNSIIRTGYIDDHDKPGLYSGSSLFVFPALYEGFGMPVLEAMACGVPAITSNTSSLPEVVGEGGIMVDPKDKDGLSDRMSDILTSSKRAEELIKHGNKQATMFSWKVSGEKLKKVIRAVHELDN